MSLELLVQNSMRMLPESHGGCRDERIAKFKKGGPE